MSENEPKTRLRRYLIFFEDHWLFSIIILVAIVIAGLATFTDNISKLWSILYKKNIPIEIKENQNLDQQTILYNIRDSNISVVQNQDADSNELVDKFANSQKSLGKTESELEKTKSEKQELQDMLDTYKREDKEIRAALARAENTEKTIVIGRIFQEYGKGDITREEALKLSDMVNKTLWEDLKSFLENKNIQIDEHNQSLVVSGIFMAKIYEDRLRSRYNPAKIDYVLTPEGDKLYEIAKTVNWE
jgi:hypothetical protein